LSCILLDKVWELLDFGGATALNCWWLLLK
jgi:hypothetical protein